MFKFRRIFWKIFLAFWVANLMVLGGTMLVIIKSLESHNAKDIRQKKITEIAQNIVTFYEKNNRPLQKDSLLTHLKKSNIPPYALKLYPHRITSDKQIVIFDNLKHFAHSKHQKFSVEILSPNDNAYQVVFTFGPPPKFIMGALRKMNSLQFIFIFFISGFVSFFLSWSITTPLKKLGTLSRQYTDGDTLKNIDSPILTRGDEIGDLARDIDSMNSKVNKNIQNQKQLLHDVSHELRAPLSRLQAVAGILQQAHPENALSFDKIHSECEHIDKLIHQILSYSRLDQAEVQISHVDLSELIRSCTENLLAEFPERQINIHQQGNTLMLHTSEDLLRRACDNIIRNACKYSPSEKPIDINLRSTTTSIEIAIRDYGPGVDADDLTKLSKPFYRAENKMHTDGFGLGLSISARAIEKLGGTLELRNIDNNSGFLATITVNVI